MNILNQLRQIQLWRWATLLVLLVFFAGVSAWVAERERERLLEVSKQQIESELDLLAIALRKALLRGDYPAIEEVILQWGRAHQNGGIVDLNVTATDGRVIAQYTRATSQQETAYYTRREVKSYDGSKLMTVEIIRDFTDDELQVEQLRWRLAFAMFAVVLALWICIQYIAHLTLNKLNRRIRNLEDELHHYRSAH